MVLRRGKVGTHGGGGTQVDNTIWSGTAAEWAADGRVLGAGVPGYVSDTTTFVVGDGATATDSLAAAGSGTYARSAQASFRAGRVWMFAGDSITNGSAASNFVYGYSRQACHMTGTLFAASDSVEAGTVGYLASQLLTQLPSLLSTYAPAALHLQVGTNDSGNAVPLSTYSANIIAIVALAKARGIPVTIGTVPPRGSSSATAPIRALISAYNMWLRMWAPGSGVEIADVHAALADSTTGDMLAAYDSGDGVHPNDTGHRQMARVVSAAMLRTMPTLRPTLVSAVNTLNLVVNPLNVTVGTDPTSSISAVATGTAPTRSIVADASGVLPAGSWAEVDLTAAATSVFAREFAISSAGWVVGDVLGITGFMQVEDVTGAGAWDAAVAAGTASVSVSLVNQAAAAVRSGSDRCAGRVLSAGVYNIGPWFTTLTIAAGTTGLTYRYQVNAPNGLHVKARFGCLGVFNLTALGISGGGASMINVDGP